MCVYSDDSIHTNTKFKMYIPSTEAGTQRCRIDNPTIRSAQTQQKKSSTNQTNKYNYMRAWKLHLCFLCHLKTKKNRTQTQFMRFELICNPPPTMTFCMRKEARAVCLLALYRTNERTPSIDSLADVNIIIGHPFHWFTTQEFCNIRMYIHKTQISVAHISSKCPQGYA